MSSTELVTEFPKRLKVYLLVVAVVFVIGYFSLIFIENMSFVDAFYFLIVTVTTVGFGDITPKNEISKIIVSVLIIISISTLALVSEQIVNRIVAINTQAYLELPEEELGYRDHIIVCGFTNIGENITFLLLSRFFKVIVLDPHAHAAERARRLGVEAYFTQPQQAQNLKILNIDRAMALYLFMDDENKNVLTSLQAKSLNQDLLIYASTQHELSIELGNLIGITRTYHYERIVASNIRFSLFQLEVFSLPNQLLSPNAQFFQVMVRKDYDWQSQFPNAIPVGMLDETLTEFIPIERIHDEADPHLHDWNYVLTITRDKAQASEEIIDSAPKFFQASQTRDSIVIGGFDDTARHIVKELDPWVIENFAIKILTFSKAEAKKAESEGYTTVFAPREELPDIIRDFCTDTTLVVNLFNRLTDSLLVNTVVRRTDLDIYIVQLAHNQIETEVLIKSGVNRILIPDILMSRGMFLILLSTKRYINSVIYGNAHLFEHYIDDDSPIRGKSVKDLENLGYYPLLYREKSGVIRNHVDKMTMKVGDSVLLFREHEIVRQTDQLVDYSHN